MHERGTYGSNGHNTNGYSALAAPVSGDETSLFAREAVNLGSLLLSMGFGALTGHLIAKDLNKGIGLGLVGGFFAYAMMEQTRMLRRIEQKL